MNKTVKTANQAKAMHTMLDADILYWQQPSVEVKSQKHYTIQERDVSYRFYAHFHPYVRQLMDRMLREGTRRLQAADTEYCDDAESLPESIEVALKENATITIPKGAEVSLNAETDVTLPNGTATKLAKGMVVHTDADAAATVPALGLSATLLNGMTKTPRPGDPLTLGAQKAFLRVNGLVKLKNKTPIILYNGLASKLDANSELYMQRGTEFSIGANTQATLIKSVPKPKMYADVLNRYGPTALVQRPYPVRDLDFSSGGAYSVYNWELFFHAPLIMAMHLSKNQRFGEAQQWFHYLFDPTDDSDGPTPERFWKVRPFQMTDVKKVEEILVNLATGANPDLVRETVDSIYKWQRQPFRPHVIARYRQQAYMYKTLMAYLDNIIAWGDSLFRQDTGEAIDEALMLYVLAANILGPKPQPVPTKGTIKPQTYENLRKDLNKFGVVMREIEADPPFDLYPLPPEDGGGNSQAGAVRALGKALYFCVPPNDKLLSYWDTVADRLFKIRNSLNLQGVFRQLALWEPPIDPALLARAAAAGLDISAIVNGLNQPLPLVRFQILCQKAAEIAQEVKTLGNSLLSAMEKEDGEAMALLRAKHERVVMEMVEHVKYAQLQEAIKSKEGLLQSLAIAMQRHVFYERQLGKSEDDIKKAVPALVELDSDSLDKMKFSSTEPEVTPRNVDVDIATDAFAQAAQALNGGKILSSHEVRESLFLEGAQLASDIANITNMFSSVGHAIPSVKVHIQPWGMGSTVEYGGRNVGDAAGAVGSALRAIAERLNFEARRAARIDGFARREREWAFQSNLAAGEITQIFKQIRAAQIRQAIAEMELKNHRQQMKQAEEIEYFLNGEGTEKTGKKTNKALYAWMKREAKGLYSQCFQFAFDVAKKAERALQHELGDYSLSYLQFGYLAGKEGLLAGERLYLDIKRMEMAHLDLNRREYEMTKHVSLLQLDPQALIELRTTGRCTIRLPEESFNMDGPSHYFRRIKNVAVSIPCVTGPYASVNCTLTLLKSSIRITGTVGEGRLYARENSEDDRFADYHGSMQSIVTSSAQSDGGLFETNLRDERYLPFENSGVISEWQLQLPSNPSAGEPCQFDYNTISDVVLHIRYTAREGGEGLRTEALRDLKEKIDGAKALGSIRLFSLRHDFPSAWAAFKSAAKVGDFRPLSIKLTAQHYPFWSKTKEGQSRNVTRADLIVRAKGEIKVAKSNGANPEALGAFIGDLKSKVLPDAVKPPFEGDWNIGLSNDKVEDAWLLVHWG